METKEIDETDTDGLEVEVINVNKKTDKGGTVEGYIVKLLVEGEEVTITLWDTALKILVQGGPQQVQCTTRTLIPYLENEILECQKYINSYNVKVLQTINACNVCAKTFHDSAGMKKHMINHQSISASITTNPIVGNNKFLSEQQLDESIVSVLSDLIDDVVEKGSKPGKLESPPISSLMLEHEQTNEAQSNYENTNLEIEYQPQFPLTEGFDTMPLPSKCLSTWELPKGWYYQIQIGSS